MNRTGRDVSHLYDLGTLGEVWWLKAVALTLHASRDLICSHTPNSKSGFIIFHVSYCGHCLSPFPIRSAKTKKMMGAKGRGHAW